MQETSSSLVRGIADFQDHQSWFEFDQRYRQMIRTILLRKGLRADQLDDAVQDVYVSLLTTIQRFRYDRSRGKFRSWISKIAQRTSSATRRKHVDNPLLDEAAVESPDGAADIAIDPSDTRMQLCLEIARNRFDDRSWLPFYLRVIEDTPIEEVQKITEMNRNAVYQAVHRVKVCLREMMSQLDIDPAQPDSAE